MNSSNLKCCVIPVCKNRKFNLVHKFPSDLARFNEWMEVIQKDGKIEPLQGLSDDSIRKRYFICSRHFTDKEYKNIESRSLNLTAVPSLNFKNLDQIHLSRAWRENESSDDLPLLPQTTNVSTARILNTNATQLVKKNVVRILKRPAEQPPASNPVVVKKLPNPPVKVIAPPQLEVTKPIVVFHETILQPAKKEEQKFHQKSSSSVAKQMVEEPPMKKLKTTLDLEKISLDLTKTPVDLEFPVDILSSVENIEVQTPKPSQVDQQTPKLPVKSPVKSSKSPVKVEKVEKKVLQSEKNQQEENSSQPANKLLALFEVTPEQYEKLSKSLSSAERSENVESLLNFIDNNDIDPSADDNELELNLDGDCSVKVDLFWLRDHCRCENCYDQSTNQRQGNILDIPDDINVKSKVEKDGKLEIIWSDKHESSYDLEFIIKNQLKVENHRQISLWDKSTIETHLKTSCRFAMRDYMTDHKCSKKVLENLHRYGFAFIDGVQPTQQNTEFVIRELFPVHKTFFGEMWTFSDAKKDHSDTAYTNHYIGPHTDNMYFNDASGLQIFHCINYSGEGGETFLIDGFQVAKRIKDEHPEVFDRLTKTIVTAEYIEEGRHHKYSSPMINLDPITGEVVQIRFNLYDRAPFNSLPQLKVRQFYRDLKVFASEFEKEENRIMFKLQPGTVLIFDNWRVLHGRLAYCGKRTMTGCYVARTEFQSALRVNHLID